MTISEMYDINRIVIDIEVALQIDGQDYGEKDVDVILNNIKNRIIRQYQIDLHNNKITDDVLYVGKARSGAVLFVENIAALHSRLTGYLHIVRYLGRITVRPMNVNYMGFSQASLLSFFMAAMTARTLPDCQSAINAIKKKFGSVNSCIEKKLILILLVCYEFGFDEMVSAVAEIFYLGGKV